MSHPNLIILYVRDAEFSSAFYGTLFDVSPIEQSNDFAMFVLAGGLRFGVWARDAVKPAVSASAGAMEIAIPVADKAQVEQWHQQFRSQDITIAQTPEYMDFGYTFTALDPDGHRLRVYAPSR
ncbi:VOC family protein [Bowmanella sp. Y26]|uniref:VOC family protein n=1 Tax=Bowmanella yangjiangensis TaxID=2811230 RepID=UPI001BDC20B1|nr:VOC family protein [Bowmanella yangjiangensis]MBT1062138.1 VOC family protein [Bowmanella yangjiangensis]